MGKFKFGKLKGDTVKWTGKEKKIEYWECNDCYENAMHLNWLEEKVQELFGKKCPDYEPSCIVCQAWSVYEGIIECENEKNTS